MKTPRFSSLSHLALVGLTTFLLAAAPDRARAQNFYVANFGAFTVGEYNANTGAVVRNPFVSSADGVADPDGLALAGNTLYVANVGTSTVAAYDATTDAASPGFTTITVGSGGSATPNDVLAAGGLLYVSVQGSNTVNAYNAATGATAPGFTTITGLNTPAGLTLLGTTLYVSNVGAGTIRTYDARTGTLLNPSFLADFAGANFLTAAGNALYVSDVSADTVRAYNAPTRAALTSFATIADPSRPTGVKLLGNTLYLASYGDGNPGTGFVSAYDATTGTLLDANFITGLLGLVRQRRRLRRNGRA